MTKDLDRARRAIEKRIAERLADRGIAGATFEWHVHGTSTGPRLSDPIHRLTVTADGIRHVLVLREGTLVDSLDSRDAGQRAATVIRREVDAVVGMYPRRARTR